MLGPCSRFPVVRVVPKKKCYPLDDNFFFFPGTVVGGVDTFLGVGASENSFFSGVGGISCQEKFSRLLTVLSAH